MATKSGSARCGLLLVAVLAAVWLAVSAVPAAPALADGDPASDVLAAQPLFLPQDAGASALQQAQLQALLARTRASGHPLRVALVASASDLGSVTELWREPATYAHFLAEELALVYRGPLVVVMPDGYGFYDVGARPGHAQAVLASLPAPGQDLATAALRAIQRLAAAAGVQLPLAQVAVNTGAGSTDPVAIAVLIVGAILILAAWAVSLRARPPGWLSRPPTTG